MPKKFDAHGESAPIQPFASFSSKNNGMSLVLCAKVGMADECSGWRSVSSSSQIRRADEVEVHSVVSPGARPSKHSRYATLLDL